MDGQIDFKGDEILQSPFPPVGAYICATAKHLTEEDWDVLAKYFYLMVPMSERQRSALAKAVQETPNTLNFSMWGAGTTPHVVYRSDLWNKEPSENFDKYLIEAADPLEYKEGDTLDFGNVRFHVMHFSGKRSLQPRYKDQDPSRIEDEGDWRKFTWPCGYNIAVKVK